MSTPKLFSKSKDAASGLQKLIFDVYNILLAFLSVSNILFLFKTISIHAKLEKKVGCLLFLKDTFTFYKDSAANKGPIFILQVYV